jgi:CYTH domain-containing protein
MEIERKFKVRTTPLLLEQYEKKEIEQAYLCTDPVIRIRKSNSEYYMTYKSTRDITVSDVALCCQEVELPLTEEAYLHLRQKTDGNIITKTRYLIPIEGGFTAELDVFHGHLQGLCFTEVEFSNEEDAAAFTPPEWFGDDVSFDKRFKNNYLTFVNSYTELGLKA